MNNAHVVDNRSSGTHRLRGPERRCGMSKADEKKHCR